VEQEGRGGSLLRRYLTIDGQRKGEPRMYTTPEKALLRALQTEFMNLPEGMTAAGYADFE